MERNRGEKRVQPYGFEPFHTNPPLANNGIITTVVSYIYTHTHTFVIYAMQKVDTKIMYGEIVTELYKNTHVVTPRYYI